MAGPEEMEPARDRPLERGRTMPADELSRRFAEAMSAMVPEQKPGEQAPQQPPPQEQQQRATGPEVAQSKNEKAERIERAERGLFDVVGKMTDQAAETIRLIQEKGSMMEGRDLWMHSLNMVSLSKQFEGVWPAQENSDKAQINMGVGGAGFTRLLGAIGVTGNISLNPFKIEKLSELNTELGEILTAYEAIIADRYKDSEKQKQ